MAEKRREEDYMEDDKQRALSVYTALLEAWNRRDADAFAALFTDTGSSVGFDGSPMNGRAEIASTLRAIFADHVTATYVAKVREMRSLSAGVVLVRAVAGMILPGQSTVKPEVNAIQSVVVVIVDGRAAIALFHSTPAAFHGRPNAVVQLTTELTEVLRQNRLVAGPFRIIASRREGAMLGGKPWNVWIEQYGHSHQHPVNRWCHTLGIPLIVLSLPLFVVALFVSDVWRIALALFVVGWIFQFVGHAIEGKPPEFLKDWRFLFVGLRWWVAKMRGRA